MDKNVNQTNVKEVVETKFVNHSCGNPNLMKEARLSFVSGHTSIRFFSATFLASFMNRNLNHKASLPLQVGIFILAFWISITRITDYKHHVQDIFFGALLGTIIAWFTRYKQNVLKEKVFKEELGMNMSVDENLPK